MNENDLKLWCSASFWN